MTAQIIEIAGQKMAILPIADYERLLEAVEDQADVAAAEKASLRAAAGEEYVSADVVDSLLAGENALRVWRKHRNMTLDDLAEKSGVRKSSISELENGKEIGRPAKWRALADALDVTVDDILPLS